MAQFCETEMRQKLKDCQGYRTQSYQHIGRYLEGDLVWYQYQNNNAWLGPAEVLFHRGQSVWIHTNGDVKKVASFWVKLYQLIDRKLGNDDSKENDDNQVMLEDGLRDVKELKKVNQEDSKDDETNGNLEDEKKDTIGA